ESIPGAERRAFRRVRELGTAACTVRARRRRRGGHRGRGGGRLAALRSPVLFRRARCSGDPRARRGGLVPRSVGMSQPRTARTRLGLSGGLTIGAGPLAPGETGAGRPLTDRRSLARLLDSL